MPELPEVETIRRGIEPYVLERLVVRVIVRESRLRWPVSKNLATQLERQIIAGTSRRAKYLLLGTVGGGSLMIHFGMSGTLRIVPTDAPVTFHDHIDIVLDGGYSLRYNDPRRFGSFHWLISGSHPLLDRLGPEPLSDSFDGNYLYTRSRGRKSSVKQFLMDSKVVVGIGNIYANEVLFLAGVRPDWAAGQLSVACCYLVVEKIKLTLDEAIRQGGTTLRDFVGGDGRPGYFAQQLMVYGRAGQPCRVCKSQLKELKQSNRSTVFCSQCQC